ncbi:MAG TPA: glycosyltransferase family A protein [Devosia sp.]|uniref:glycosyltransferase family 2 protein n=1 Tax=Devosia sp. TaxID=1871048 RepID=UPI002DDC9B05|nr:glycosyltransferase family A protein [Devosia sp.]HEV2513976.1 glycosyltransferase family A protein [Devosia sp.]
MTDSTVAVVIPAYKAEGFIKEAVRSVFAQTHADWEAWVVTDDGEDYDELLGRAGLVDPRFHFLSTGRVGAGASRARNLALDRINTPYVAILDADDRMKPRKLELAVAALADQPIVSSALDVMDDGYSHLRFVGDGKDRVLQPGAYKFVNLSMDSMIVWDRRRCDARYDLELTNMTDLELLMQLWRTAGGVHHLGTPQHDYLKVSTSMSNGVGFTEKMIASKKALLGRLETGAYRFAAAGAAEGLIAFLGLSLAAEAAYPMALQEKPGVLFEDHLEPMLRAYEARMKLD